MLAEDCENFFQSTEASKKVLYALHPSLNERKKTVQMNPIGLFTEYPVDEFSSPSKKRTNGVLLNPIDLPSPKKRRRNSIGVRKQIEVPKFVPPDITLEPKEFIEKFVEFVNNSTSITQEKSKSIPLSTWMTEAKNIISSRIAINLKFIHQTQQSRSIKINTILQKLVDLIVRQHFKSRIYHYIQNYEKLNQTYNFLIDQFLITKDKPTLQSLSRHPSSQFLPIQLWDDNVIGILYENFVEKKQSVLPMISDAFYKFCEISDKLERCMKFQNLIIKHPLVNMLRCETPESLLKKEGLTDSNTDEFRQKIKPLQDFYSLIQNQQSIANSTMFNLLDSMNELEKVIYRSVDLNLDEAEQLSLLRDSNDLISHMSKCHIPSAKWCLQYYNAEPFLLGETYGPSIVGDDKKELLNMYEQFNKLNSVELSQYGGRKYYFLSALGVKWLDGVLNPLVSSNVDNNYGRYWSASEQKYLVGSNRTLEKHLHALQTETSLFQLQMEYTQRLIFDHLESFGLILCMIGKKIGRNNCHNYGYIFVTRETFHNCRFEDKTHTNFTNSTIKINAGEKNKFDLNGFVFLRQKATLIGDWLKSAITGVNSSKPTTFPDILSSIISFTESYQQKENPKLKAKYLENINEALITSQQRSNGSGYNNLDRKLSKVHILENSLTTQSDWKLIPLKGNLRKTKLPNNPEEDLSNGRDPALYLLDTLSDSLVKVVAEKRSSSFQNYLFDQTVDLKKGSKLEGNPFSWFQQDPLIREAIKTQDFSSFELELTNTRNLLNDLVEQIEKCQKDQLKVTIETLSNLDDSNSNQYLSTQVNFFKLSKQLAFFHSACLSFVQLFSDPNLTEILSQGQLQSPIVKEFLDQELQMAREYDSRHQKKRRQRSYIGPHYGARTNNTDSWFKKSCTFVKEYWSVITLAFVGQATVWGIKSALHNSIPKDNVNIKKVQEKIEERQKASDEILQKENISDIVCQQLENNGTQTGIENDCQIVRQQNELLQNATKNRENYGQVIKVVHNPNVNLNCAGTFPSGLTMANFDENKQRQLKTYATKTYLVPLVAEAMEIRDNILVLNGKSNKMEFPSAFEKINDLSRFVIDENNNSIESCQTILQEAKEFTRSKLFDTPLFKDLATESRIQDWEGKFENIEATLNTNEYNRLYQLCSLVGPKGSQPIVFESLNTIIEEVQQGTNQQVDNAKNQLNEINSNLRAKVLPNILHIAKKAMVNLQEDLENLELWQHRKEDLTKVVNIIEDVEQKSNIAYMHSIEKKGKVINTTAATNKIVQVENEIKEKGELELDSALLASNVGRFMFQTALLTGTYIYGGISGGEFACSMVPVILNCFGGQLITGFSNIWYSNDRVLKSSEVLEEDRKNFSDFLNKEYDGNIANRVIEFMTNESEERILPVFNKWILQQRRESLQKKAEGWLNISSMASTVIAVGCVSFANFVPTWIINVVGPIWPWLTFPVVGPSLILLSIIYSYGFTKTASYLASGLSGLTSFVKKHPYVALTILGLGVTVGVSWYAWDTISSFFSALKSIYTTIIAMSKLTAKDVFSYITPTFLKTKVGMDTLGTINSTINNTLPYVEATANSLVNINKESIFNYFQSIFGDLLSDPALINRTGWEIFVGITGVTAGVATQKAFTQYIKKKAGKKVTFLGWENKDVVFQDLLLFTSALFNAFYPRTVNAVSTGMSSLLLSPTIFAATTFVTLYMTYLYSKMERRETIAESLNQTIQRTTETIRNKEIAETNWKAYLSRLSRSPEEKKKIKREAEKAKLQLKDLKTKVKQNQQTQQSHANRQEYEKENQKLQLQIASLALTAKKLDMLIKIYFRTGTHQLTPENLDTLANQLEGITQLQKKITKKTTGNVINIPNNQSTSIKKESRSTTPINLDVVPPPHGLASELNPTLTDVQQRSSTLATSQSLSTTFDDLMQEIQNTLDGLLSSDSQSLTTDNPNSTQNLSITDVANGFIDSNSINPSPSIIPPVSLSSQTQDKNTPFISNLNQIEEILQNILVAGLGLNSTNNNELNNTSDIDMESVSSDQNQSNNSNSEEHRSKDEISEEDESLEDESLEDEELEESESKDESSSLDDDENLNETPKTRLTFSQSINVFRR